MWSRKHFIATNMTRSTSSIIPAFSLYPRRILRKGRFFKGFPKMAAHSVQCKFACSLLTACDRVGMFCRHDFLGILEPYMMEEKKGLVDFLRTAVGCFRDLPRGHIISLAQHMQQVLLFITLALSCAVLHCTVLCCAVTCYHPVYAVCMLCSTCCAIDAMLHRLCSTCYAVYAMPSCAHHPSKVLHSTVWFESVLEETGKLVSRHT